MSVVWKWEVPQPTETGRSYIDVPEETDPLSVGLQGDALVVWGLVSDPAYPKVMRRLIVANTGGRIPGFPLVSRFLGSASAASGVVWHVWDGGPNG